MQFGSWILLTALGMALSGGTKPQETPHYGRHFVGVSDFTTFQPLESANPLQKTLQSPVYIADVPANEIVVSWNVDAPEGTGVLVEANAYCGGKWTKYYCLGHWSKEGVKFPRESVKGQKDSDGDVETDTLVLKVPAERAQVRVTLKTQDATLQPRLKYLGVSFTDTRNASPPLEPLKKVWGTEVVVPAKWQSGWEGANGWCSPTSTAMALAFWAQKRNRPELDVQVPNAAHAIFDKVYDGTGNWSFNTAFAGAFPGIRAYVTRLGDIRQLEEWIEAGIPPVVSLSYDLLRGVKRARDPGHLMVCVGFAQNGDIVLNDPAHHPERGEVARRVFSRANFLKAWRVSKNTVYLIYPEDATPPADRYGHWDDGRSKDLRDSINR